MPSLLIPESAAVISAGVAIGMVVAGESAVLAAEMILLAAALAVSLTWRD